MIKTFLIRYNKLLLLVVILLSGCSFDLHTKKIAKEKLKFNEVRVINNVFDLTYVENHSVAFGFLKGIKKSVRLPLILIITGLIGMLGLLLVYRLRRFRIMLLLALIILLAGAFGNITDRMIHGYVTDFFHVYYKDKFDFPVFNVADVLINIGIFMLLFQAKYFDRAIRISFAKRNEKDKV